MDLATAAQVSEAVAEKMLQYRRDKSGWKICREGVSEERGQKGVVGSLLPGAGVSEAPRLLLSREFFCILSPGARLKRRFHWGLFP